MPGITSGKKKTKQYARKKENDKRWADAQKGAIGVLRRRGGANPTPTLNRHGQFETRKKKGRRRKRKGRTNSEGRWTHKKGGDKREDMPLPKEGGGGFAGRNGVCGNEGEDKG